MQTRKTLLNGLALLCAISFVAAPAFASSDWKHSKRGQRYKVTVTNITAGQPLTPPILVTHSNRTRIFDVGEASSFEIQQVAENGDGGPLLAALAADPHVHDVVAGTAPLVPANNPGGTPFDSAETFVIEARGKADMLSFVSMLICTNDGFAGLDSIQLPRKSRTVYAASYDARSEANTEDFADMVPPCQGLIGVSSDDMGTGMSNPLIAEDGIVIPHPGINGGVDLHREVHGWSDPVVKIVIERM